MTRAARIARSEAVQAADEAFRARCPRCMAKRAIQVAEDPHILKRGDSHALSYALMWLEAIAEREDLKFCDLHKLTRRKR